MPREIYKELINNIGDDFESTENLYSNLWKLSEQADNGTIYLDMIKRLIPKMLKLAKTITNADQYAQRDQWGAYYFLSEAASRGNTTARAALKFVKSHIKKGVKFSNIAPNSKIDINQFLIPMKNKFEFVPENAETGKISE